MTNALFNVENPGSVVVLHFTPTISDFYFLTKAFLSL